MSDRDYLLRLYHSPPVWPSIKQIQLEVCGKYNIGLNELLSARRARRVSIPRQEAMYRAYRETVASLPIIGRAFDRDHTTVLHAIKRHQQRNGLEG